MLATNEKATEIVLDAAVAARLTIRSSMSPATWRCCRAATCSDPDLPVGMGGPAYPASKAASELVARGYQAAGAPVVTTYPGVVVGPYDPYFGDSDFAIAMILRNRIPFVVPGGWPVADVRYVAEAHEKMLEPVRGPRRYLLTGNYVTSAELFASLRSVTGRRLPALPTPGPIARATGRAMDGVQHLTRARCPFGYQGAWSVTGCAGTDDVRTRQQFGIMPPVAPADTRRLHPVDGVQEAGHLSARHAGDLTRPRPTVQPRRFSVASHLHR